MEHTLIVHSPVVWYTKFFFSKRKEYTKLFDISNMIFENILIISYVVSFFQTKK
jgi:hypothetical protein